MRLHLTDLAVRAIKPDPGKQIKVWDTTTPGFGVLVSGKVKSWIVMYGVDRRLKVLGRYPDISLKDARVAAFEQSRSPALSPSIEFTVREAYDRYISAYSDVNHRESTATEAKRILTAALLAKHAASPISQVTKSDVTNVLDRFASRPASANRTFAVLRAFFGWAVRHDYLKQSPCAGLQRPAAPVQRDRVLSHHEIKCVWQATSSRATFDAIVRLLILTGQRRGEIAALQTSWITDNEITLPKELTKNGRQHTLPIAGMSISILRAAVESSSASACIFPARGAQTPFNGWSKSKAALDKKLGDKVAPWTLHDLRRTFATNLAALGVRMEVTEKLLNHISGSFGGIVGVYQKHAFTPEMRDAVERWQTRLVEIIDAPA